MNSRAETKRTFYTGPRVVFEDSIQMHKAGEVEG